MKEPAPIVISDEELLALSREGRVARLDALGPLRVSSRRLAELRKHIAARAARRRGAR